MKTYTSKPVFSPASAFAKIWGCNSAVADWYYNASDPYWGALNYKRNPKPSMAETFAQFAGVVTYGANSGSHIEVNDSRIWITSAEYKIKHGQNPSGSIPNRLQPD